MAEAPGRQAASDVQRAVEAAQARLVEAVARFRQDLASIEQLLRGPPPPPSVTAAAQKPPEVKPPSLLELTQPGAAVAPTITSTASAADVLRQLFASGIKTRPFDEVTTVICPEPITIEGADYDAGLYYDAWIVIPSVDTRISFTGPPDQNTPFVGAGQSMNFQVHMRHIYYQAALSTLRGTLSLWLARYKD